MDYYRIYTPGKKDQTIIGLDERGVYVYAQPHKGKKVVVKEIKESDLRKIIDKNNLRVVRTLEEKFRFL